MRGVIRFAIMVLALSLLVQPLAALEGGAPIQNNQPLNRLIVKLRADLTTHNGKSPSGTASLGIAPFDALNEIHGVSEQHRLFPERSEPELPDVLKNTMILEISDQSDISRVAAEYEALDEVEYAEPDRVLNIFSGPNDSLYMYQWGLNNTGQSFPAVLRDTYTGEPYDGFASGTADADCDWQEVYENPPSIGGNVVVAVIDYGLDLEHPDIVSHVWVNSSEIPGNLIDDDHNGYVDDCHGWDFRGDDPLYIYPDADPSDPHGHGTHCSGIIAAVADNSLGVAGMSNSCTIMPAKVGPGILTSTVAEAIVYAANNGADVISMSIGGPFSSSLMLSALEYAIDKGVVPVAASGNDGQDVISYPAAYPGVIAVGASTSSDYVAGFSTSGNHLSLIAPGEHILSLRADSTSMYGGNIGIVADHYAVATGTSMACPMVAGAAACLRSISTGLNVAEVRNILETTAEDIVYPFASAPYRGWDGSPLTGWDKYSGYGRLNLYQAVQACPTTQALITSPLPNLILSGQVDIDGIAEGAGTYQVEYGAGADPDSWTTIQIGGCPINGTLASWDASNLSGLYTIRLTVGATNFDVVMVNVSNGTVTEITSPESSGTILQYAEVVGTAMAPNLEYWILEYESAADPGVFHAIRQSSVPVVDGQIAYWSVGGLAVGNYNLRLSTYSSAGLLASDVIAVTLEDLFTSGSNWMADVDLKIQVTTNYGDFDGDGNDEIVVGTMNGLVFYNPDGTLKTSGLPTGLPSYECWLPVAVGRLDCDDADDFVTLGRDGSGNWFLIGAPSAGNVFVVPLQEPPAFNLEYAEAPDYTYSFPQIFLKDIDGDGIDEIHYEVGNYNQSGTNCAYMYDHDGTLMLTVPQAYGGRRYQVADMNGDGQDEIYIATYHLTQIDFNGQVVDDIDLENYISDGFNVWFMQAYDVDGDGDHELIILCQRRVVPDRVYLLAFDWDNGLVMMDGFPRNTGIIEEDLSEQPVFVDFDRDGSLEYFITTLSLNDSYIHGWHWDGTPFLSGIESGLFKNLGVDTRPYPPVIADIDGDQSLDILLDIDPGIWYALNLPACIGRLGAFDQVAEPLPGWPVTTYQGLSEGEHISPRVPMLGDVNQDGKLDVTVSTITNKLLFLNLDDVPYDPDLAPVPSWRYNRRLNNCGPLAPASLAGPDLIDPDDGAYLGNVFYFVWDALQGADHYEMEVATNTTFCGAYIDTTTPYTYLYVSTQFRDLFASGISYWRVRANVDGEWTAWSDYRSVTTTPPPSCPVLFVNDGSSFVQESPLLTACQQNGYRQAVTDYYMMNTVPAAQDGMIKIQLREMEDETTYLDDLSLMAVDHSAATRATVSVNGDVVLYEGRAVPLTAVDADGVDRLEELSEEDGNSLIATEPGYVTVTFESDSGVDLPLRISAPPKDRCRPLLQAAEGSSVGQSLPSINAGIHVAFRDASGGWLEADQIPSREDGNREIVVLPQAGSLPGGTTVARISWDAGCSIDFIDLLKIADESPELRSCVEVAAKVARAGSDYSAVVKDSKQVLEKGDALEFMFAEDGRPANGMVRDYIVRAVGRYQPNEMAAGPELPESYRLYANYPNPFNPQTTIKYVLPQSGEVSLQIYNVRGQLVTTLVSGWKDAGVYTVAWSAADRASGVYFYRLQVGAFTETRKMILLK